MELRIVALIIVLITCCFRGNSQSSCTTLGQNPGTAFPVCGTASFSQNTVAVCGDTPVPGIGCANILTDKNPYWYKFTCFEPGKLGFQITPNDLGDDYDWQLYDITGKSPNEVYTNASIIVASNWSGESGVTGASPGGNALNVCEGPGKPLFSSMPTLIKDHEYILLVSHFTDSQSGYKLSFGGSGSTASITDTKPPEIASVQVKCDASQITVNLNKKMRCNTLATNGSDFQLSTPLATITAASSQGCSNGFDMETFTLTLSNPLPPGNYKLISKAGTDGNTVADNCGAAIAAGETPFVVSPIQPTPMDSLVPVTCAPGELKLIFRNGIKCNSIAANGSDFIISGPSSVPVTGALINCDPSGFTKTITIKLQSPIQTGGTYKLTLVNGSDLNTLIDECGQSTPAGSSLNLILKDTVSAAFSYSVFAGCKVDTINFLHPGANGVNTWKWTMDDNKTSTLQSPTAYYTRFGQKQVSLIVSNGFCSDTTSQSITLANGISAKFLAPAIVCPQEPASFIDSSTGKITTWSWEFGNGFTSASRNPAPQSYEIPVLSKEVRYNVRLIIGNETGCFDTATATVKAVSSCYIAVPSAFTPNRDGVNDYLFPLNAFKATNLVFRVFNRYGQIVFETTDWNNKWDGTIRGKSQPAGIYVWTLTYTESDSGKQVSVKGSSALIR